MDEAKNLILADAIETAIRDEKKIIRLKQILTGSVAVNLLLIIYIFVA